MNTVTVRCSHDARKHLIRELDRNNIPYEFISLYTISLENSPKGRMALQMTKERNYKFVVL